MSIYSAYSSEQSFEQAFAERFGVDPPEALNQSHQLLIVASELDNSTERIVTYLSTRYGVPINAIFFRYIKDDSREYLARTWLIDPGKSEVGTRPPARPGVWNEHDFYVSLGEGENRTWDDCVQYGFISGGQGRWYSRTLEMLFPGARVFVCIPKRGYVGVGIVKERSQRVRDFTVDVGDVSIPILEAPVKAPHLDENADDADLSEYLVRIDWITTLLREQAIWEKGMYANQGTVTRLRNKATLDRLEERFGLPKTHAAQQDMT